MTALIFPEKVRLDFIMLQQKLVLWTLSVEEPGQAGLTLGGICWVFPHDLHAERHILLSFHRNRP